MNELSENTTSRNLNASDSGLHHTVAGSRRHALHIWWQRWDRVQKPIGSSNLSSPGLKMAQGGDASLLEAMERLKRENEALVKKCETLTLEKELDRLERDKIQTRFSTPGLETETPKPQ
ncbi:hypothetical protein DPMN_126158 [Dreissena polymorpha]|uniref:Uncharacterized protein n=1 Tax=Dreissena polymorpha TaxID=45954 RepID=A0A9D4GZM1_DREPO|nr:hypothetical protein DPMN_126158 [Dreissena polymorpha]